MNRVASRADWTAPARTIHSGIAIAAGVLATAAIGTAVLVLANALPSARWLGAALSPSPDRMDELVFAFAVLPRMAGGLLAGALLGLAGAVFQQVIRNPLATPDTMAVTGGAQLALAAMTLAASAELTLGRFGIAFAGGALAVGLVLLLSARSRFAPATLLLTGLSVTLYVQALTTLLVIFHAHELYSLLVWSGGSLAVQDWSPVTTLALWGVGLVAVLAVLMRPLSLFALDDAGVRALGGHTTALRLASLAVAVGLSAAVSSSFGAIGFVGLGAPTLARMLGVRRLAPLLAWSAVLGGLMLWAADNAAALMSVRFGVDLPAGGAVAILGAPVLVGLAVFQREGQVTPVGDATGRRRSRPGLHLLLIVAVAMLAVCVALTVGRSLHGWDLAWSSADLARLMPWRAPRTLAAAAAGALLGLSGFLLQRVTGNPMAAPEMMGLGAGAGAGLMLAIVLGADPALQDAAAVAGAVAVALALLAWVTVGRVEPGRMLVTGLALATGFASLAGIFAATGDPRGLQVLAWMTGSTYRVTVSAAATAASVALLAVPLLVPCARWLDLMPLGAATRQGFGLPEHRARGLLILFAAVLAGCGTLLVGPMSFVGLVAPRMAVASGLPRALAQGLGSVLIGALLMVLADAAARTAAFPWQVPTGIMAALLGSPVLIVLLGRARP